LFRALNLWYGGLNYVAMDGVGGFSRNLGRRNTGHVVKSVKGYQGLIP